MTRKKADEDPWLTDPISRDRVIAKTVVEGMHSIIQLLRGIRNDLDESRALRDDIRRLEGHVRDLEAELALSRPNGARIRSAPSFEPCPKVGCGLPSGHTDPHRPRMHAQ